MVKSETLVWSPKGSPQHRVLTQDKGKENALQNDPRGFQKGKRRFRCQVSNNSFPLRFHQEEKSSGPVPGHCCLGIWGWHRPHGGWGTPPLCRPLWPGQIHPIPRAQPRSGCPESLGTGSHLESSDHPPLMQRISHT